MGPGGLVLRAREPAGWGAEGEAEGIPDTTSTEPDVGSSSQNQGLSPNRERAPNRPSLPGRPRGWAVLTHNVSRLPLGCPSPKPRRFCKRGFAWFILCFVDPLHAVRVQEPEVNCALSKLLLRREGSDLSEKTAGCPRPHFSPKSPSSRAAGMGGHR